MENVIPVRISSRRCKKSRQRPLHSYRNLSRGRGTGGHWGQVPLHFLYLGKKCPFSGMKVPYFHGIEVPFLQNLSALFSQCPLTFEVLPRPLNLSRVNVARQGPSKPKQIPQCLVLNARSIVKPDAYPALYAELKSNNIDVCCISETWLNPTIASSLTLLTLTLIIQPLSY